LTFRYTRVQSLLKNAVLLQVDVTQNTADDEALLKRFGLFGPPGILFFDPQGRELKSLEVIGYQDADKFLVSLNSVFAAKEGECAASVPC